MSKQEFLDTLRRALARELSEGEVADNINYYWNYIEQEIAFGKSEEQVLSELGDPRLIARTILQVDEQREEDENGRSFGYQEEVFTANPDGSYDADAGAQNDPYSGGGFHGNIHVEASSLLYRCGCDSLGVSQDYRPLRSMIVKTKVCFELNRPCCRSV